MNVPFDPSGSSQNGANQSDPGRHDGDRSLTPEERALAQRLSRLGGAREPGPALDARILAAAHDAVRAPRRAPGNTRRRWPVALGVAASLALAVGIAWRLRPLPDAAVEYSEAPAAAQIATRAMTTTDASPAPAPAPAGDASTSAADSDAGREQAASPAPSPPAEHGTAEERKTDAASAASGNLANDTEFARTPEAPDIVFDEAASVAEPAAPKPEPQAVLLPPPPAPPAPRAVSAPARPAPAQAAAATGAAAGEPRREQQDVRRDRAGHNAQESDAAAEAEAATVLDRIETTGSRAKRVDDQPYDDQPPVSADAPQVQQAWLQRIRELLVRGQLDEARASLAEYRHRYPGQPLPDDLRALEQ